MEVFESVAVRAQRLMRAAIEKGWSLKPADALHLATAHQLKVKEFHTYDERLKKFAELTDNQFTIVAPISSKPHLPLVANDAKEEAKAPQPEG